MGGSRHLVYGKTEAKNYFFNHSCLCFLHLLSNTDNNIICGIILLLSSTSVVTNTHEMVFTYNIKYLS